MVIPDIAKGDQLDAFDVQQGFEQDLAFLAVADEGDVDGVQRRLVGGGALFAGIGLAAVQQQAGARRRGRADEFTTIQN